MNEVKVPFGTDASETATLLLAAAEKEAGDQSVVRTTSYNHFLVPEEIAKAAEVDYEVEGDDKTEAEAETEVKEAPAKKTAAKKTTSARKES